MHKKGKFVRNNSQEQNTVNLAITLCKGVAVSFFISLTLIMILAFIRTVMENDFATEYMQYIMVAITMISIFVASLYAGCQAKSKGFIIGCCIGIIYVLISIGIGMKSGQDSITFFAFVNKLFAGAAAGALGGMLGINL